MSEIEKMMKDVGTSLNYRIVNLGGQRVYIEGIKTVVSIEDEKIQFQLKNNLLIILGKGLKIEYLDLSTCVIAGNVGVVEIK